MGNFLGIVVDQSLKNARAIDRMTVIAKKQIGSWGLLLVSIPEDELSKEIAMLQSDMINVKEDCWYAHFFQDDELIVVYQDRTFHATVNPETWTESIQHGLEHGIPMEQLDFTPRTRTEAMAYFGLSDS